MNQAPRWLPIVASVAMVALVPHAAHAQKKKGTKGAPAPTPAAAAPASADADADTPAAPAGGAAGAPGAPASADQPAGGDQGAAGGAAGGDTGGATGEGAMDVCQITPDAPQCQAAKEFNLAAEAKKPVRAEVYAVQQQYVIKAQRFEIMPYFETTLNDQFVSHNAPGLALNYYITQVLAVGVNGNWYGGINAPSDFNFQNRRAALISAPLTEYQYSGDLNFTYVPMYGKFAGFGDFIFHYDAYVDGGVGVISTRPIPVIDPDNRKFNWNNYVNFDVGIGFRIFFSRWLAAVFEVRDIMYFEKIESTKIAPTMAGQIDPGTWYDSNTHFTNDVQLQLGLSMFLPTSFDYRLPK